MNIKLGQIQNDAASYQLMSSDGKLVLSGKFDKQLSLTSQTLNVSNLAHGTYIMMLADGSNKQTMTIIIN